ncbi:MAG: hypothetical protein ACI395_00960 [Candidatus Cryptobacteroides sp.]
MTIRNERPEDYRAVEELVRESFWDVYRHAGFVPASTLNIHYHDEPEGDPVPYFLARELITGYLDGIEGTYCPPEGYFIAHREPEAFREYEATFPHKEAHRLPGQLPQ